MKKLFLTVILLSTAVVNLEADGTFGKSFGGAFLGSTVSNVITTPRGGSSEDCSFEKEELHKAKRTYEQLKRRNKKLANLHRKIQSKRKKS